MIYSLDTSIAFSPYDLDMETTVEQTVEYLESKQLVKALVCSLRLNEEELVQRVLESVSPDDGTFILNIFLFSSCWCNLYFMHSAYYCANNCLVSSVRAEAA